MRHEAFTEQALEAVIRIGVVALLVVWCFEIVRPFVVPILWGMIIAVAVFPPYRGLRSLLGERPKLAAAVMTAVLLLLMVGPVVLLVSVLAENLQALAHQLRDGTLVIPPPPADVKNWPFIGLPIHTFWSLAASNLSAAVQQLAPQLKGVAGPLIAAAAAVGLSMVELGLAVVLSGAFLAYSEDGYRLTRAIGRRLAGERGVELVDLGESTMRSVARGVLGIAVVQSLMAGAGLALAGVPFAGLWTVVALFFGVIQIGVGLVMVPAAIYVFTIHETFTASLFLVWTIIVIFTDNALKPLLLGRGLDVPMVVIFVGALGGMIASGIIGLFVGAILLALGYKVFLAWLAMQEEETESPVGDDRAAIERD